MSGSLTLSLLSRNLTDEEMQGEFETLLRMIQTMRNRAFNIGRNLYLLRCRQFHSEFGLSTRIWNKTEEFKKQAQLNKEKQWSESILSGYNAFGRNWLSKAYVRAGWHCYQKRVESIPPPRDLDDPDDDEDSFEY